MTNYEKIKGMSVAELEEFVANPRIPCETCVYTYPSCRDKDCNEGFKKWLESEAEDNE